MRSLFEWLNVVWKRQPGILLRKCTMLVLDSLCEYMMGRVKVRVNKDSSLLVIPGG
jgi:hypothetical protein